MAGRIPPAFIDQLLARVDIVEVVNSRVPLKKAGREFQACCPFHNEKTPSFTVIPQKQFFHCFGCQESGSAIGFVMKYDGLSFPDAVETLAHSVGMEVPHDGSPAGPDNRPLYEMLDRCQRFYKTQLREHPERQRAVDYLKRRGLSGQIAARYQIGFAPPGWDSLRQALGQDSKTTALLREAGMLSEGDGKLYDRFRERVMFPIRDRRGRVIGFGGRVLGDGKPKYLNSPETPVFHKGRELYGLFEARQANKALPRLLVVEGYMDVVALAQFGIDYAVATLGTATTAEHLRSLFRTSEQVVFCFDGDRAGRAAAWKALETTLPALRDGLQAHFLFLPDGEDPDTLVRKLGAERFGQLIDQAQPLSDYLFAQLSAQVDLSTDEGRARLAQLAQPLIGRIPAGVFHELMLNRLKELIGATDIRLQVPASMSAGSSLKKQPQRPRQAQAADGRPVSSAIQLLLHHPDKLKSHHLPPDWKADDLPGLGLLLELMQQVQGHPEMNLGRLLELWHGREQQQQLLAIARRPLEVLEADVETRFEGLIARIERQRLELEYDQLMNSGRPLGALSDAEKQRLRELLRIRELYTQNQSN